MACSPMEASSQGFENEQAAPDADCLFHFVSGGVICTQHVPIKKLAAEKADSRSTGRGCRLWVISRHFSSDPSTDGYAK